MKKFEGDLKRIDPKLLVSLESHDKVESFFIRLGIIFNNLKSLLVFEKLLVEEFERPGEYEETAHAGEHSGTWIYIQTSIASTIHEFFEFLKKNKKILEKDDFKVIFNKIPKKDQQAWSYLLLASEGKFDKVTDMQKAILNTRNHVGFHFDHHGSNVWDSYVSRFFRDDKNEKNRYACYSIDEKDFYKTRFYFADAVVEEKLYLNAGKKKGSILKDNEEWKGYFGKIKDTVNTIVIVIPSLMKKYIESKRNKPN